jgi:ankyrin repeat protein
MSQKIIHKIYSFIENNEIEKLDQLIILLGGDIINEFEIYKDIGKDHPIVFATKNNKYEILQILLKYNSNVNMIMNEFNHEKDGDKTPLIIASKNGFLKICELLIKNNADVNIKDSNDRTSLHYASRKNHINIVKLLVENGANINDMYGDHSTALHEASRRGYTNIVKYLINNGSNVDTANMYGDTPLILSNDYEISKMLIEKGARINYQNNNGDSALHRATLKNNKQLINYLINQNAKTNITNYFMKMTPKEIALKKEIPDIIQLFKSNMIGGKNNFYLKYLKYKKKYIYSK